MKLNLTKVYLKKNSTFFFSESEQASDVSEDHITTYIKKKSENVVTTTYIKN